MTITVNNVQTNTAQFTDSVTLNYAVPAGSNQVLVVLVSASDNSVDESDITDVAFNGSSISLGVQSGTASGGGDVRFVNSEIWYLDAPGGTHDIVATTAGTVHGLGITAWTLNDAAAGGPEATASDNSDTTTPYDTLSVTTLTDAALICELICQGDVDPDFASQNGQTQRSHLEVSSFQHETATLAKATAGAQTLGYTGPDDESTAHVAAAWAPFGSTTASVALDAGIAAETEITTSIGAALQALVSRAASLDANISLGPTQTITVGLDANLILSVGADTDNVLDDVVLPLGIRFGSGGVARTSTQQAWTVAGYRKANQRWNQKLRRLRQVYKLTIADIYDLLEIWQAVEGPEQAFLARDWNDWNTTDGRFKAGDEQFVTAFDQPLRNTSDNSLTGDGSTTTFQAAVRYVVGSASHVRVIKKPQNGTVTAAVDGVELTEGVDFNVNYSTGVFTFFTAPGSSGSPTAVQVTWGGAFYVPVHFLSDEEFEQQLRNLEITEVEFELQEHRPN